MAKFIRLFGVVALAAPLTACAPTTPSPVTLTSATLPPPVADYWTAITVARSARDRAAAVPPPKAADLASRSDEDIAKVLREWASTRRNATQAAHRAYAEALLAARAPSDEAEVYGELADLWLRLEEDTRSALFAATPATYREDPSLVSAVQGATVYALRPLLDRVAGQLGACQRVARVSVPDGTGARLGAAVNTCADVARRLDKEDDPRPAAPARGVASSAPERAVVSTTHPRPCTFKGTLRAHGTVYASETGTAVVLPLDGDEPMEVDSLAVASTPGGRYKVSVTWPKAVEGYLETDDAPFVLSQRVEIGPDEVWDAGARFTASDALGPTVRVIRDASDAPAAAPARGEVRRLFCHDLDLATTPRPHDRH